MVKETRESENSPHLTTITSLRAELRKLEELIADDEARLATRRRGRDELLRVLAVFEAPAPAAQLEPKAAVSEPSARTSPLDTDGSVLAPYLQHLGKGSKTAHLKSTEMVRDVLEELGHPVKRPDLLEAFYQRFPQSLLAPYWGNPDGSVKVAITRAVNSGLIRSTGRGEYAPVEGGPAAA